MPTSIKFIITLLVIVVSIGSHYFQAALDEPVNQWLVLAIGAVMIFALWLFPETKSRGEV